MNNNRMNIFLHIKYSSIINMPYSDLKRNLELVEKTQKTNQISVDAVNAIRDLGELLVGDGTAQSSLDPSTGADKDVLVKDSAEDVGVKWNLPNHMTPSGATPGPHTLSNITVDDQGLILSITSGSFNINDLTPTMNKGDLIVNDGASLVQFPKGLNGEVLLVDTGELTCLKWGTLDINDLIPTTTKGDLLVDNGTSLVALPAGLNGTFLLADSGEASGLKYGVIEDIVPFTAKGDLLIRNTFGQTVALPNSNTDNDVLMVDMAVTDICTAWKPMNINNIIPSLAKGDILVHDENNNMVRLPIGNNGDILTVDTTVTPICLAWKPPPAPVSPSDQYTMIQQNKMNGDDLTSPLYISDSSYNFPWSTISSAWQWSFPFAIKGIKLQFTGFRVSGSVNQFGITLTDVAGTPVLGTNYNIGVGGSAMRGKIATYILNTPLAINTPFLIQGFHTSSGSVEGRIMLYIIH